jgi:uncharacterized membrane protein
MPPVQSRLLTLLAAATLALSGISSAAAQTVEERLEKLERENAELRRQMSEMLSEMKREKAKPEPIAAKPAAAPPTVAASSTSAPPGSASPASPLPSKLDTRLKANSTSNGRSASIRTAADFSSSRPTTTSGFGSSVTRSRSSR